MKIRKNSNCHYCNKSATTRDHIVPKCMFEGTYDRKVTNFVPACSDCNRKKGHKRSNCRCLVCTNAWNLYGPIDKEIEIIDMFGVSEDDGAVILP